MLLEGVAVNHILMNVVGIIILIGIIIHFSCMHAERIVHVIDLKTQDKEDSACAREGPRTKM